MRGLRTQLLWCLVALALAVPVAWETSAEPIELSGGNGAPISLVVRDAPLAQVFEMLSRKERVNVLLGKGVKGTVSVNLFEVSVDQAIRAISEAAGYIAERRRGTYIVIDRKDAGKESAQANTMIRAFKVEYSDPKTVSQIIEKYLSRYGEVTLLESRRLVVIEDLPDFIARVEQLLGEIDQEPRQILIEAKILEIRLDETESFGVDWSRTFNADDGTATIGVRDLAMKATPGLFFDLMTSDMEIAITALDDQGRVRTLSTPTLLALEHEEAEVVIGDRLGFRVTTTINAVTTESVEFLESGVILKFRASVDRQGSIVLDIHPEVSTGAIEDGLPSQNTTEVTTKLVMQDGQRVFIAGLIRGTQTSSKIGVPYVMDIPILGWLFRRTEHIDVNTETVVILTAHVVNGESQRLTQRKLQRTGELEEQLEERRRGLHRNFSPAEPEPAAESAPEPLGEASGAAADPLSGGAGAAGEPAAGSPAAAGVEESAAPQAAAGAPDGAVPGLRSEPIPIRARDSLAPARHPSQGGASASGRDT